MFRLSSTLYTCRVGSNERTASAIRILTTKAIASPDRDLKAIVNPVVTAIEFSQFA